MGILGLADILRTETPKAIRTPPPDHYRGKILAVDASIFICQFQTAIPVFCNRHGDSISVLQGLFNRTIYMLSCGIRPIFVFDGIPPDGKRSKTSKDGGAQLSKASRSVHHSGSEKHSDLKTLLTLLGVPFIQAPSEAEATCAALVKTGRAWGAVTEDMDALPFGCTRLIRNLKADKNKEIEEFDLTEILKTLQLSQEQFVDLCILLGCDYSSKVRYVGAKKALRMIQKFKSIERILLEIPAQDRIPPDFRFQEARKLFMEPNVADVNSLQLKWENPDEDGVVQFLCKQKCMNENKVRNGLKKLHPAEKPRKRKASSTGKGSSPGKQRKMQEFFPVRKSPTRLKASQLNLESADALSSDQQEDLPKPLHDIAAGQRSVV
ncbi:flap endonuclease 1-like [Gastrophryne carolinensis]